MSSKPHNGYPSWNAWNVSLWINNNEGLYNLAIDLVRHSRLTRREAAQKFLEMMPQRCTPDGAPWTVTNILRAMREM